MHLVVCSMPTKKVTRHKNRKRCFRQFNLLHDSTTHHKFVTTSLATHKGFSSGCIRITQANLTAVQYLPYLLCLYCEYQYLKRPAVLSPHRIQYYTVRKLLHFIELLFSDGYHFISAS